MPTMTLGASGRYLVWIWAVGVVLGGPPGCKSGAPGSQGRSVLAAIEGWRDWGGTFQEGLATVAVEGRYGYIDRTGKVVIRPAFEFACPFSEGRAMVCVGGRVGYIDTSGNLAIPCRYEVGGGFQEGLAAVRSEGRWGFIDKGGRWIIAARYDDLGIPCFYEGLAPVAQNGKWGYIGHDGEWMIAPRYDVAGFFVGDRAPVMLGRRWGYIDRTGTMVIPAAFCMALSFGYAGPEGYGSDYDPNAAVVSVDRQAAERFRVQEGGACIDRNGRFLVRPGEGRVNVLGFSDGLCAASVYRQDELGQLTEVWGYVDKKGQWVIPPRHRGALPFSEGLAAVHIQGKWGFIDRKGEVVISPVFEGAGGFSQGFAAVRMDGKWGYIDRSGSWLWRPTK